MATSAMSIVARRAAAAARLVAVRAQPMRGQPMRARHGHAKAAVQPPAKSGQQKGLQQRMRRRGRDMDMPELMLSSSDLLNSIDEMMGPLLGASPFRGSLARRMVPEGDAATSPLSIMGRTHVTRRDEDGAYVVRVELPGVDKADTKVSVKDGVLTVHAERHDEYAPQPPAEAEGEAAADAPPAQRGSFHARFDHSWSLPDGVDESGITAKQSDGVLSLVIPPPGKPEENTATTINVD